MEREEGISCSQLISCQDGLECEGECVPWSDWCQEGSSRELRCGSLVSSPRLCQSVTFWATKPCPAHHQRCTGWWPGQCRNETGDCRDGSGQTGPANTTGFCIQGGDRLVPASPAMFQCQAAAQNNTALCAVQCDRRLEGCKQDKDEADCLASSNGLTLVLVIGQPRPPSAARAGDHVHHQGRGGPQQAGQRLQARGYDVVILGSVVNICQEII